MNMACEKPFIKKSTSPSKKGNDMQKKEYKAPKMKEIKLKARASLLSGSSDGYHGTVDYNDLPDSVEKPEV
ncbi:hypothetical protein B7992_15995 [Fibrobacter sp. UWH1]|nr:hypothetical protein B7992_15995 [Fibrobacter sp. UWH1]